AVGVILSSIPLYMIVKQDYIPSDVDEAEFDINVTAPEGASLGAMDDAMRLIEKDLGSVRGVRLVLSAAGGSFLGNVNNGRAYVRIAPHEERIFSIGRFLKDTITLRPWKAFQNNYSQKDVMQEVRKKLKKYKDLRCSVRNAPSFSLGGGNFDIDYVLKGPDLQTLAKYADQLRQKAPSMGIIDADITLKLDKPELRVEIDRARAADLGIETADIATALRIMVGGDEEVSRFYDASINENYDVQ